MEAVLKMKTEQKFKNQHQFRVRDKRLFLRPENVRFRFSKLFHNRWPKADYYADPILSFRFWSGRKNG